MRRALSRSQIDRIVELGDGGKSGLRIAAALGLSAATVNYQLLRAGIDPWPNKRLGVHKQPGGFTPEEDARLLDLARKGSSIAEISRVLCRAHFDPHTPDDARGPRGKGIGARSMTAPVRLQLSRRKGFNLQALSHATNGLDAVRVARPGAWGNPFRVAPRIEEEGIVIPEITRESAVTLYREYIERCLSSVSAHHVRAAMDEHLRGKNLACWCKPGEPCHADVLLEIANRG